MAKESRAVGAGAVHCRVTGRVQGVGFRWSVLDVARRLGLAGWVRNTADGAVEVQAQGSAEAIEALLAYLHEGPRSARVRNVEVAAADRDASLTGFDIR